MPILSCHSNNSNRRTIWWSCSDYSLLIVTHCSVKCNSSNFLECAIYSPHINYLSVPTPPPPPSTALSSAFISHNKLHNSLGNWLNYGISGSVGGWQVIVMPDRYLVSEFNASEGEYIYLQQRQTSTAATSCGRRDALREEVEEESYLWN